MWDLRTFAQFQRSETSPGLLEDFMDGYITLRLSPLAVEHSVVVMTPGSQTRRFSPTLNIMGS